MRLRAWLGGSAFVVVAALSSCTGGGLLGVDVCNKLCDTAQDCGDGFECSGGKCTASQCGNDPGTASGGASSGNVGQTSSVMGSGSSNTTPSTSSAASGTSTPLSSSRASSGSSSTPGSTSVAASSSSGVVASTSRPPSSTSVAVSSSSAPMSSSMPAPCQGRAQGDSCGAGLVCETANGSCISACFIGGSIIQPDTPEPGNPCRACRPLVATNGYRALPNGATCTDNDPCTTESCQSGTCEADPLCTGATPSCNAGNCSCTTNPADSCLFQASNKACLGTGQCGCNNDNDCAALGEVCGPANVCVPCNTADACGMDCESCRTAVGMTLSRGSYYTCDNNNQPANFACSVTTCPSGLGNCDDNDLNQCETNLVTDANNCGVCGVACPSGDCNDRQCTCPGGAAQCPSFAASQSCSSDECRCQNNNECPAGTTCNTAAKFCRY